MKDREESTSEKEWVCGKCGEVLVLAKVEVRYVGTTLTVDLLKCPRCGLVMVTEETAVGKMAEAEQVLEDK
jgi:ribosomal protein S27AE